MDEVLIAGYLRLFNTLMYLQSSQYHRSDAYNVVRKCADKIIGEMKGYELVFAQRLSEHTYSVRDI